MSTLDHLPQAIRDLRDKSKLSQREAARRLGITAVYLCNLEKGTYSPSLELLGKMARMYGTDPYVLAAGRAEGRAK